jgi:Predicted metal-binding protein
MTLKNLTKFIILLILSVSLFFVSNFVADKQKVLASINNNKLNVEVFKTPSCGCCYGYVLFLEKEKFNVKQTDMRSLHSIKKKYNIPIEMQSCHTTIMGKYFIEGHVPLQAVNKLLKEQPDIDGIALPGMPIGTPGMPGEKEEPYVIYQLIDGKFSVFMTI